MASPAADTAARVEQRVHREIKYDGVRLKGSLEPDRAEVEALDPDHLASPFHVQHVSQRDLRHDKRVPRITSNRVFVVKHLRQSTYIRQST